MEYLGYLIGPLGCALGMVVMMAMMARGRRSPDTRPSHRAEEDAVALRAEVEELRGKRLGAHDG